MIIIERLKLELGKQNYFTDIEYEQYLTENALTPFIEYSKPLHEKALIMTCIDILYAVLGDVMLLRKCESDFIKVGDATKIIENRIKSLEDKLKTFPDEQDSIVGMLFFN